MFDEIVKSLAYDFNPEGWSTLVLLDADGIALEVLRYSKDDVDAFHQRIIDNSQAGEERREAVALLVEPGQKRLEYSLLNDMKNPFFLWVDERGIPEDCHVYDFLQESDFDLFARHLMDAVKDGYILK